MANKLKTIASKIFTFAASIFIMSILLIAGPAEGFSLGLTLSDATPSHGEKIKFTTTIEIENNEHLPVEELTLKLLGPEHIICRFDFSGNLLNTCEGITITRIDDSQLDQVYGNYGQNFGYGYGFCQGELKYEIRLDTLFYEIGTYDTMVEVEINGQTYTAEGQKLTIKKRSSSSDSRSCRTDWQCSEWSPCSNGIQVRECSKMVSSCYVVEDIPDLTRQCNLFIEDYEETVHLNKEESSNLSGINAATLTQFGKTSSNSLLIVFLLMNCIITTLNIIVKVSELQKKRKRKFRKKK